MEGERKRLKISRTHEAAKNLQPPPSSPFLILHKLPVLRSRTCRSEMASKSDDGDQPSSPQLSFRDAIFAGWYAVLSYIRGRCRNDAAVLFVRCI